MTTAWQWARGSGYEGGPKQGQTRTKWDKNGRKRTKWGQNGPVFGRSRACGHLCKSLSSNVFGRFGWCRMALWLLISAPELLFRRRWGGFCRCIAHGVALARGEDDGGARQGGYAIRDDPRNPRSILVATTLLQAISVHPWIMFLDRRIRRTTCLAQRRRERRGVWVCVDA